ncbi:SAPC2 protein, partial [Mystacornis crossleyi]|nr:SAPC2 protein [Mystacornis crossleyi]
PRGRGEWRRWGLRARGGDGSAGAGDWRWEWDPAARPAPLCPPLGSEPAVPAGPIPPCRSPHRRAGDARRHQRGRAEHRRHTITNGVDFSMLKYMKELEREKDFLLQGLELIDRAREWYHHHIQLMQEHQRLLGKKRTSADFPEGGQSHLGRLVPKLQEVNRCLGDLLSTAGKTANTSSALSRLVPVTSPAATGSQQAINMLKEQNRLLTK